MRQFVQCSGLVIAVVCFFTAAVVHAQDSVTLETPQQTNQRIQTLTMGLKTAPHDYTIGNGDLLSITVFDVPELSREVRVSQSGTVSIPLVPVRLGVSV